MLIFSMPCTHWWMMTNLFRNKCNFTMIDHFISLTKNWIKRLPSTLEGIVDRYCPRCCIHHAHIRIVTFIGPV
nr:hypothetical protein Iba_chr08eCG5550 [Ipomoea batatas]GMD28250.1 hypothetical protein Iba_chr08eCG5560 [Ipomoea batatas]